MQRLMMMTIEELESLKTKIRYDENLYFGEQVFLQDLIDTEIARKVYRKFEDRYMCDKCEELKKEISRLKMQIQDIRIAIFKLETTTQKGRIE